MEHGRGPFSNLAEVRGADLPAAPNPFREATALRYTLPAPGPVRLGVYDLLGREVAVLVDEEQGAGTYDTTFAASGLAAGVYVVSPPGRGTAAVQRVTLVR